MIITPYGYKVYELCLQFNFKYNLVQDYIPHPFLGALPPSLSCSPGAF